MVTYELSSEVHSHQHSQQCWGKPSYLHQRFLGENSAFGEGEDGRHAPLPLVNSTYDTGVACPDSKGRSSIRQEGSPQFWMLVDSPCPLPG